jgi:hypothetical protein
MGRESDQLIPEGKAEMGRESDQLIPEKKASHRFKKMEEDVLPAVTRRSKGFMAFYPRRLSSFVGG